MILSVLQTKPIGLLYLTRKFCMKNELEQQAKMEWLDEKQRIENLKEVQATHGVEINFREPKNAKFVQISDNSLPLIRELMKENPASVSVLFFFIEQMSKLTNSVICSYTTLEEVLGYSRATIAKAIKTLKEKNWIDTIKIGNATAYCVNEQVAWRLANNQRHYAIFSSTVIATSTENKDFQKINKKLKKVPIATTEKIE